MQMFTDCYLLVLGGQDKDIKQKNPNWEEAWKTIEMKTGYIYATTATIGAMAGTDNEDWISACKIYGYHLGLAIQIFNDIDGVWAPNGISDLQQDKTTLPVLYAMHCEHKNRQELIDIVRHNQISVKSQRVKEILDIVDAKSYLVWLALKQKESALNAIDILHINEGCQMLEAHFTGMFGDIEELLIKEKTSHL